MSAHEKEDMAKAKEIVTEDDERLAQVTASMEAHGVPSDRLYAILDALTMVDIAIKGHADDDAQDSESHAKAQEMLEALSPEERAVANEQMDAERKRF